MWNILRNLYQKFKHNANWFVAEMLGNKNYKYTKCKKFFKDFKKI